MNIRNIIVVALTAAALGAAAEEVSRAQFETWMDEVSNWGRWGDNDELGTLNLITPAKSKAAAAAGARGRHGFDGTRSQHGAGRVQTATRSGTP